MWPKAKWEHFHTVYECYKAGRKAEQLMLSRSYLNTGYHRKYAKEYCAATWGPTDRSFSAGI